MHKILFVETSKDVREQGDNLPYVFLTCALFQGIVSAVVQIDEHVSELYDLELIQKRELKIAELIVGLIVNGSKSGRRNIPNLDTFRSGISGPLAGFVNPPYDCMKALRTKTLDLIFRKLKERFIIGDSTGPSAIFLDELTFKYLKTLSRYQRVCAFASQEVVV
jgi:hypothetical protein